MNVFQSAITEADGQTVNVGYLALFWLLVIVLGAIPFMCIFAAVAMWLDAKHAFEVQALGVGIGAVCGGFATALGALGIFLWGDRRPESSAPKGDQPVRGE